MTDEREFTDAEIEALQREDFYADADAVTAELYPRASNLSAGMLYRRVIRPREPVAPEYVTLPLPGYWDKAGVLLEVTVARWNLLWEAAQLRRRFFAEDGLPPVIAQIADRGDVNVVFVPRTSSRYYEYAPLFHLLPHPTVQHYGLPPLRCGQWPYVADTTLVDRFLPADFEHRLSRAWAATVWRHLISGSPLRAFSSTDPIRLLAHNLDYWIPPVTAAIQDILGGFPRVDDSVGQEPVPLEDGSVLEDAVALSPRVGSQLWQGQAEAAEVVRATVEHADAGGRLRGILEAVRAHRVQDDFSDHWSFAREDFERKLYSKRSKVTVRFVELTDTVPVQGPETEVLDGLVYGDFLALLDPRERQVVVLLHSGVTKLTEIADLLGYANHSPVSKRLARIRDKANAYFRQE